MGSKGDEKNSSSHVDTAPPPPPPSSVIAMAWDPTSTAALALCRPPTAQHQPTPGLGLGKLDSDDNQRQSQTSLKTSIDLDVFLSHDGTGCPAEETECLIRCLDSRDAWLTARKQQQQSPSSLSSLALKELSMEYRVAMCKCLMQLQEKATRRLDAADTTTALGENDTARETISVEEGNNMELLTVAFAISHLAEVFLLPSLATSGMITTMPSTRYANNVQGEVINASTAGSSRLDGPAGSLTADTVRYLRKHHSKAVAFYMDMPQVQAMLESDQPEYYRFTASTPKEDIIPGPFELPYWNLVLQLVIEGNLSKAWALLSQHSACRHVEVDDSYKFGNYERDISPDRQAFEILQSILLSAPLPGGRGDIYCDDTGLDDYVDEELLEQEEAEESQPSVSLQRHQHRELNADDLDNMNFDYMDGVSSNAYLLWEALPRRADRIRMLRYRQNLRLRGGAAMEGACDIAGSPTVPELYQPRVALNMFRIWQETIREVVSPPGIRSNIGSSSARDVLAGLFRRFPPLQQIISILVGEAPPSVVNYSSLSWNQRLLMELLYSRPNILPEDIAIRAKVAMEAAGADCQTSTLNNIILSIMKGSAGQVVDTMFSVCGGSSGAALPATIVSMKYCLSSMIYQELLRQSFVTFFSRLHLR
jgi:hypothetical protein